MKRILYRLTLAVLLFSVLGSALFGCDLPLQPPVGNGQPEQPEITSINILNGGEITLEVGDTLQFRLDLPAESLGEVTWKASNDCVTVTQDGLLTALKAGTVAVTAKWNTLSDAALVTVVPVGEKPEIERPDYGNYTPAQSAEEAVERSQKGMLSGSITVPDQAPVISPYRPRQNGLLIRNNQPYYADSDTYVVVDCYGNEVLRVYRGGGYITLEEVAAYVYAFGNVPANYVKSKYTDPENSIWGEYLRLNHSKFSGNTQKYPYEPVLPNISGCGGDLYYYEIDIGTTGTDCDPGYSIKTYNDGTSITRGAARIVYTRYDKNENDIIDPNEKYLFYTYNHYNDFQEYLNYYGGWGEMFGNITGGGTLSSKYDYAPTPYIPVYMGALTDDQAPGAASVLVWAWIDPKIFSDLYL